MTQQTFTPDNLPTLTEVVGESTGDFPTLTEIVDESPGASAVLAAPEVEPSECIPASPLAEAFGTAATDATNAIPPQLSQTLENHIKQVFARKLHQHLAAAQQQAVEQAIAELKSELPQLIRDALEIPNEPT